MGIFAESTPNHPETASDWQTGLLMQQKLIIKTEKLCFIAPHQHRFMIELLGLAFNYSVPNLKQRPCRMGEGHCPLGIYSLLLQLGNTLLGIATTQEQGKCVSDTTFRHPATCSKLYLFFDPLQYDLEENPFSRLFLLNSEGSRGRDRGS